MPVISAERRAGMAAEGTARSPVAIFSRRAGAATADDRDRRPSRVGTDSRPRTGDPGAVAGSEPARRSLPLHLVRAPGVGRRAGRSLCLAPEPAPRPLVAPAVGPAGQAGARRVA